MNIKLFKKGDIAVIAVIIAAAVIFAFFRFSESSNSVAVITVDGKTVETVELHSARERMEITPCSDYNVKIVAENGEIWFEHSDCMDKLCVNSGKLRNGGEVAVCLPAKTVISVSGSDVDAVVY